MKGIIIYKGKYGATRQYAAWLRDELGLQLVQADHCKSYHIELSDIIVIGTSIYVGKMQVSKWLKKNLDILKKKKVFLFVVCGTAMDETQKLESYLDASMPAELRHHCSTYFLPGRLVYKKLSSWDKFMLRMGAMLSKDPVVKEKMMTDYDSVKKECLSQLLADVKKVNPVEEPACCSKDDSHRLQLGDRALISSYP